MDNAQYSFVYRFWNYQASTDKIDWVLLTIFSLILYLIALIIPIKLTIILKNKHKKLLNILIWFTLGIFVTMTLSGGGMGQRSGIFVRILNFIYSLLSMDLSFIFLFLFVKKSQKLFFLLVYIIITFMFGSKSGLLTVGFYMYCIHILKGGKIIEKKYMLIMFLLILSWPIVAYISGNVRAREEFNLFDFFSGRKFLLSVTIIGLSRRMGGIDILMISPIADNVTFSAFNIFLYLIKGIFTSGIIDAILGKDYTVGIGTSFAEEFLGQTKGVPNAFSPTLFGIIHLSPDAILTSIILLIATLCIFYLLIYFKKKWIISLMLLMQIIIFPRIVVFAGTVLLLTAVVRQIIFLSAIMLLYNYIKEYPNDNRK
jgi:hypothetical protein